MESINILNVSELAGGEHFVAKQMAAMADETMPNHFSNLKSISLIYEVEYIPKIYNNEVYLISDEARSIPALVKHQIKIISDFQSNHFMSKEVEVTFIK